MKPCQYETRKGIKEIGWHLFALMCKELAMKVAEDDFDIIIGVARGGLYPALLISGMLRKEIYPIRITRRENDRMRWERPMWKVDVPDIVRNRKILVIDDISDSGETLGCVSCRVKERGARVVKTLALVKHSWAKPKPDYFAVQSDELIVFPWDKKILIDGRWKLHPELEHAKKLQKRKDVSKDRIT